MRGTLKNFGLIACVALGVAACDNAEKTFSSEAGASVDEGGFGNPTLTNHLIATGKLGATSHLKRRFADEVRTTVNFGFNSASLTPQARSVLAEQANWIKQFPEVRFRVYGHTDLVGSNAYNKQLGQRRANAVVSFFASQGISRSRLEALVSFGETRPVVNTESREQRNRRTVTEVSGFVGTDRQGTLLDGKYAEVIYREYVGSASRGATTIENTADGE